MPSTQRRLQNLMREGLEVYPADMRGLALGPPDYLHLGAAKLNRPVPRRGARGPLRSSTLREGPAKAFAAWVKQTHPAMYAQAERRMVTGAALAGLAATEAKIKPQGVATPAAGAGGALERFVTTITNIAPQYLQYRAQQDLLEVQLDRARQGLPPLRTSEYAPAVSLTVDPSLYSPQLEAAKPFLIYGGLALGGFLLFKALSGGRRR